MKQVLIPIEKDTQENAALYQQYENMMNDFESSFKEANSTPEDLKPRMLRAENQS
jgi:hypothetical protein